MSKRKRDAFRDGKSGANGAGGFEASFETDGSIVVKSCVPLASYPPSLNHHLARWALEAPSRPFLGWRGEDGSWARLSYADTLSEVRALAQALLTLGANASRPIMVLSPNSIEIALISLAASFVGVPLAPVSPAYSSSRPDFARLRHIFQAINPALIFVQSSAYREAIDALRRISKASFVVVAESWSGPDVLLFRNIRLTRPTTDVDLANNKVVEDMVARIMFTSGTTGPPKAVPTTHGMLSANQQSIAQAWPLVDERSPVLVDWLPWHHGFGANHNLGLVLRNGGTLYIDDGKPTPELIDRTIENNCALAPNLHFNTPRGFDLMVPVLRADALKRNRFFSRMQALFYGGAALPATVRESLAELSTASRGSAIPIVSAWGSTETTCTATLLQGGDIPGAIGLPIPGIEVKLGPVDGRYELRVRGPSVMSGYMGGAAQGPFDEHGFYRTGDVGGLVEKDDIGKGFLIAGRLTDNFKLLSGTWVDTAAVRSACMQACYPHVQDLVILGRNRPFLCALVLLRTDVRIAADDMGVEALRLQETAAFLRNRLEIYNDVNRGNSRQIARARILRRHPSIDSGEITDKGTLSTSAIERGYADFIEELYGDQPPGDVICLGVSG